MGIVLHQFTVITSKTTHFEHFAPPPLFALSLSTSVSTNFFEPTSYLLFVSIFQSTSLPVSSRNDQGYTWVLPFCGYPCSRYIYVNTPYLIPSHNGSKSMDDSPYQLICYTVVSSFAFVIKQYCISKYTVKIMLYLSILVHVNESVFRIFFRARAHFFKPSW